MADLGVLPEHLAPQGATVDGLGELLVGGLAVSELAGRFGTPLFIYDEGHLRSRMREAANGFGRGQVIYASKAFPTIAMARIVDEERLWWDAASLGEMKAGLLGGVKPARMVLHGNNKSMEELRLAVEVGIGRVVVDSFDEIDRLEGLAGDAIHVWLRVTPGIEAHTHAYVRTGQQDSKFGFNLANGDAQRAITRMKTSSRFVLSGLHCHIGSQVFALDSFREAVAIMVELVQENDVEELCIGGGFGVGYLRDELVPSLGDWTHWLRETLDAHGIDPERTFVEPGRAIAAAAAVTIYTVGVIKAIPGVRTYVAVDGGMSDNPRPVLYGSGYEAYAPSRLFAAHDTTVALVGKHCESGDVLVREARLPSDLRVGELVMTPVTGAYGWAMGSNYNKLPRPAVVGVHQGQARLMVRRETVDDLFRLELGL
ncbi:diaminopimelate decarboxylase [Ferrimicrobium sp.]|uniref:diaminopimelate decarboxylase n=1 Tax=Ferrimicrobium sp. TaxID=2926050 RepID=UPI0026385174|nr:diaminopimelate decarboxylase [Ferrimicrobium sp.]